MEVAIPWLKNTGIRVRGVMGKFGESVCMCVCVCTYAAA